MQLLLSANSSILIAAHRGASKYAPDNTLSAFEIAFQAGADFIELDIRSSKDGELIVIHSATLQDEAGKVRSVSDLTVADINGYSNAVLKMSGCKEKIPLLPEVLEWAKGKTKLMVDFKDLNADAVNYACDLISEAARETAMVLSFDYPTLRYVKESCGLHTSLLVDKQAAAIPQFLAEGLLDMIQASHTVWTANLKREAHNRGVAVCVWNVDVPGGLESAIDLPADVVVTSDPAGIRQILLDRMHTG